VGYVASRFKATTYYHVDQRGSVTPTPAYWVVLGIGLFGLVLVLSHIVTGPLAAATLVFVIGLGIVLLNAGSSLSDKCQKKLGKQLSYYR
jgi:Flp pilus assembly protein TadB